MNDAKTDDFLKDEIQDQESIIRFVFSKKDFSKTKGRIKPSAFEPPLQGNGAYNTSIFRYNNWNEKCFKELKKELEEKRRGLTIKVTALMVVLAVRGIKGLKVEKDTSNNQHKRHGNIIFPEDENRIQSLCNQLAEKAKILEEI